MTKKLSDSGIVPRERSALENKVFQLAKPLDEKTIKRAELAEHLISTTERMLEETGKAFEGQSESGKVREMKARGIETYFKLLTEMSEMGDPVALGLVSSYLSGMAGKKFEPSELALTFLDDGFLIDSGAGITCTREGMGAAYSGNAYGMIFDRYDTVLSSLLLGVMLANENRISWQLPGNKMVTDVAFLVYNAIAAVEATQPQCHGDPCHIVVGVDGKSIARIDVPFTQDDLNSYVFKKDLGTIYMSMLSSGSRKQNMERFLNLLHYHSLYMCTKKHEADDEIGNVTALLNGIIHDELVRICARSHGLPQPVEQILALAFGDTSWALSELGKNLFVSMAHTGAGAGEVGGYVEYVGALLTARDMRSPLDYLEYICSLPEERVREHAQKAISFATDQAGAIDKDVVREISGIERRQFVTSENLPTILGAINYRDEKGAIFTYGKKVEEELTRK